MRHVPSEPLAADELFGPYRVFERVRRPTVGARRCSPAENSFVAVDRVVTPRGPGLLLRRAHPCSPTAALAEDCAGERMAAVGLELIEVVDEHDGQRNVVLSGCPGVRLRALAELSAMRGVALSAEVVWHVVDEAERQRQRWLRAGVTPGDAFVAFDGALHLFPRLEACARAEAPSYLGDEVWDTFVPDATVASLNQLVGGALPEPFLQTARVEALRAAGRPVVAREPVALPAVERLLALPRSTTKAAGALGTLARTLFPEAFARQRDRGLAR